MPGVKKLNVNNYKMCNASLTMKLSCRRIGQKTWRTKDNICIVIKLSTVSECGGPCSKESDDEIVASV